MKKCLLLIILFVSINVFASGSVSVSNNNITIEKGKTATVTIKASNVAGVIDISSSDTNIATVNQSKYFFDTSLNNSSTKITITGKNVGTTTIRVKLSDIATFDGEELTGNRDIKVTVKETAKKENTNKNNANTNKNQEQTVTKKEMNIKRFEIVGYNIDFNKDINEYSISVDRNVNKLYIIVEGDNFTVSGDKEVTIDDKNDILVSLVNGDEKRDYKINISRIEDKIIEKEIVKEKVVDNKITLYAMIFFEVLSIVLLVMLIKNKLKKIS